MILPVEIIEKILRKCDGKTLLTARKIDDEWKSMVDYLTQKTRIWEWCCKEEIPKNELIEYLQNYQNEGHDKWLHIYINWISCMAVSGNLIAVGSQEGRLRIFTTNWKTLFCARILAVKITSLTFITGEFNGSDLDLCLVISYNKGLDIFCFDGINKNQLVIQDVKSHSVYKNYICYEKVGGRMTIAKLVNNNGWRELTEIWFSRIYSPSSLSCMKMWEGVCTFLINNEVKIFEYESAEVTPMDIMKKKTRIKFNFPLVDSQNTQILRNDVIIKFMRSASCKNDDDVKCDFIEFFILGKDDKYSKKMQNTMMLSVTYWFFILGKMININVQYLGNIPMLHNLYLFVWEHTHFGGRRGSGLHIPCFMLEIFRYTEYSHKIIVGKHPIICIDVKETPTERKIYVSSKFNIHVISGFLPNIY
ncbi:hypothetical protein NQ318_023290 [Aromia moschata]|uniref:F-box domain-containing protein n=1 Tax=Aromia moschata TaxID=1265417 RepID=A0AAV8X4S4_9CUCU|nr:hypothetical protein NQ318_023290 [Aromia moschata]